MAATGPLFVDTKDGAELKGRQRLQDPKAFDAMLTDLTTRMEKHFQSNPEFVISDLDISQNKLTVSQFQGLFLLLGTAGVRVVRFRMFGCATLTDEVLKVISDYLRTLGADWAPSEMHLSDCAITAEGFQDLCGALEETNIFPRPVASNPTMGQPLYLRIENNYIDEAVIRQKVDAGLIKPFTKVGGARTVALQGGPKVNLLVRAENSSFGQRTGSPPSPEHAPPPKQVWDQNQQQAWNAANAQWMWPMKGGKGGGCGWMPGKGAKGRPPALALAAGLAALAAAPNPGKGKAPVRPAAAAAATATPVRPRGTLVQPRVKSQAQSWPEQQSSWQSGSWQSSSSSSWSGNDGWSGNGSWSGGWSSNSAGWKEKEKSGWESGGSAWEKEGWPKWQTPQQGGQKAEVRQPAPNSADRSRTPVGRSPATPAAQKAPDVPFPWEVHHSSEYQLDYYWNSETGESLWEKPDNW